MEFNDLQDLLTQFTQGKVELTEDMSISGIRYFKQPSPKVGFDEIISEGYKGIVTYKCIDQDISIAKNLQLDEQIVLLWTNSDHQRVVPYNVRTMSSNLTEDLEKYEKPDNIIGSTIEVKFTSLPGSSPIKAKIDTGATICSLHADNYKINRNEGTITFKSPALSPNNLTVPLIDQQAVKSADGGSEYRPVIELNIKIGDKLVNNVKVNLNDRSHMEYPVLIGKNALEGGKFLIDPRMDESEEESEWDALQQQLKTEVYLPQVTPDMRELYTLIKESEVSFADIVRLIRTDVTENVMEELES